MHTYKFTITVEKEDPKLPTRRLDRLLSKVEDIFNSRDSGLYDSGWTHEDDEITTQEIFDRR